MGNSEKGRPRLAPGRSTASFFSDVVNGNRDVPDFLNFRPELYSDEILIAEDWFAEVNPGAFDVHIACSIPTFFEMVRAVAFGLVTHHRAQGAHHLIDLGASEGTLCAAVSFGSARGLRTSAVEPNPDMIAKIEMQPEPVEAIAEALAPELGFVVFDESIGEVPVYAFDRGPDHYTEIMTFQFLGSERANFIERIAKDISPDGLFISCEKFSQSSLAVFLQLELLKDGYKARYFDADTLARKQAEVLSSPNGGMNDGMITPEEYERILLQSFDFVARFWDSGNFKGYVASNDRDSIELFLSLIPSLNSEYSTVETPFFVEL